MVEPPAVVPLPWAHAILEAAMAILNGSISGGALRRVRALFVLEENMHGREEQLQMLASDLAWRK